MQGISTCRDICSSPSTSTCALSLESCIKTPRNAVCVDGMDPKDLPASPDWHYAFRPPAEVHQGACSGDELQRFGEACLGSKSSTSACRAFANAHATCHACVVSGVDSSTWGPLIVDGVGRAWNNSEGCIARVAGNEACATRVYEANRCLSRCGGATDREACVAFARANDCKAEVNEAESCAAKLGVGSSPAFAPCGPAVGDSNAETTASIIAFFCGAP